MKKIQVEMWMSKTHSKRQTTNVTRRVVCISLDPKQGIVAFPLEHKQDQRILSYPTFTMTVTPEELITEAEANLKAAEGDGAKVPLYKFILTGGPCGGKTTALARLSSFLRERGFEVIACAEVYTIFASNGMSFDFYSTEGMDLVIQNSVLDVQLSLEDSLEKVLKVSSLELDRILIELYRCPFS